MMHRSVFAALVVSAAATVHAQPTGSTAEPTATAPTPVTAPAAPAAPAAPMTTMAPPAADVTASSAAEPGVAEESPKEPQRGDFDAGGQVRLPNGPDEMGQFATFNWIALDLKGRYYLLKSVTIDALVPLAVKKPDAAGMLGPEPSLIGGFATRLEAKVPQVKLPGMPSYETDVGVSLGAAYMREGAMLLSEKDYPLFVGDFQPGFTAGVISKVKLSSLVDFAFTPQFVYQSGTAESLTAVQIPLSLILKLGDVVKLATESGIYTGDDYAFGGDGGGRVALGASLDVKISKLIFHAGTGFASLVTGGLYPSVRDSLYIDLNVKYAK